MFHAEHCILRATALHHGGEPVTIVQWDGEVRVHVDQPWQQSHAGKTSRLRLVARLHRADVDDAIAVDTYGMVLQHLTRDRIENTVGYEDLTTHGPNLLTTEHPGVCASFFVERPYAPTRNSS
jgi:hypothetical protein